ncbi:unnamed protein product [Acanthosepion pharaonis]|uniref:Uncharacterized protein n=1 Tax=Acanthosepion pharaonis TaxID=158019 RepID=A0A812BWP0_ACAPH|nr:unnamed protein product [Sepia pharaonis]
MFLYINSHICLTHSPLLLFFLLTLYPPLSHCCHPYFPSFLALHTSLLSTHLCSPAFFFPLSTFFSFFLLIILIFSLFVFSFFLPIFYFAFSLPTFFFTFSLPTFFFTFSLPTFLFAFSLPTFSFLCIFFSPHFSFFSLLFGFFFILWFYFLLYHCSHIFIPLISQAEICTTVPIEEKKKLALQPAF